MQSQMVENCMGISRLHRQQTLLKQGWEKSVDKTLYPGVEGEEYVPWC